MYHNDENKNNHTKEKKMSDWTSLRTKASRLVLIVSLILIISGCIGGIALYIYRTLYDYKVESRHIMSLSLSLQDRDYLEKQFIKIRTLYENMPEDLRADPSSDAVADYFASLMDDDYIASRNILVKCRENTDFRNIYYVFLDEEHNVAVYIVDGDVDEWAYHPGQWVEHDVGEEMKIAESKWRLVIEGDPEYGWVGANTMPIYAADGSLLGYAAADIDLNDLVAKIRGFVIILVPLVIIVVALLAYFASRLLDKHIISYLTAMEKTAKDYAERDNINISEDTPSVFTPLQIETNDELEDLWLSMTDMENDVKETMIRLRAITARQEKLDAELSIASRIQKDMLPQEFLGQKEFRLFATMTPAREVGGDFYDFFMVDENRIALVIADVSDKGVGAALFMVISKILIKIMIMKGSKKYKEETSLAKILSDVNNWLVDNNRSRMFVTVWAAIIDLRTGKGIASNAGHEHPALRRAGEEFELIKYPHLPVLGLIKNLKIVEHEFQLNPGDRLFVYTDGVPEATNGKREQFGTDRMTESLNRHKDLANEELLKEVKKDIDTFVDGADQFDDITMLVFDYYG